jgi:serine protease Do
VRPAAALVALLLAGCAGLDARTGDGLRGLLGPSVQLATEREGGGRRAASGVVVAARDGRAWIVTTRHFLEPARPQAVHVTTTGGATRLPGTVAAVSPDADLAVIEVGGVELAPATLQDSIRLAAEVRVVAFPWGRRLTVVGGIVSQIGGADGVVAVEGPVRMIDASVSYGASGGGVFDATTGGLVGIVQSYRTVRVNLPSSPDGTIDLPVAGETTVVPAAAIRQLLETAGIPAGR